MNARPRSSVPRGRAACVVRRATLSHVRSYQDAAESPPPTQDIFPWTLRERGESPLAAVAKKTCMTGAKRPPRPASEPSIRSVDCVADVRPLRGVRFDIHHSGPVGPLIAPPYDVVAAPTNAAKFSIRKIEGVDLGAGNDHAWAAERYRSWLEQGVLRRDPTPMVYVHHHQFHQRGVTHLRTGLMAQVRLADWSERIVLPHEQTTAGPRNERLDRLRAVQANLSPLYFLYRDPDGLIRELIASHVSGPAEFHERDQMGGAHGLTLIAGMDFHKRLANALANRSLFVADGHHRYEAALAYRDECRAVSRRDRAAPSEFVLTLLVAVEDAGVIVRPTHRLLTGNSRVEPTSIMKVCHEWFDPRSTVLATPMPTTANFICRVVMKGDNRVWDLYAKPGNSHIALLPPGRGPAWRSLSVSAVEGIVRRILRDNGQTPDQRVLPVIDDLDAVTRVRDGRADAAFLLPTPSLDRLLAVAEEGDLLPAKSTWFEPKAPAGLVINDLRP